MSNDTARPRSPADIERDIDRTRTELALTLDALERRLDARHLLEKGIDMLRDSLAGNETLNRGLDVIRANPVPVALIGIGAAWLIASNTGLADRVAHDERVEAARRRVGDFANEIGTRAGELASDVAGRVGIGASAGSSEQPLGYTGNPVVDKTAAAGSDGWVHQMTDMAQGALRSVRDSGNAILNRAGNYAGDGAGRVADQLSNTFERHPLLFGGLGVMAGALLAAMVPASRVEEEWFSDAREALWQKTQEAGEEAISRVREAASRAVDAATDAAAATVKSALDKSPQS